MIDTVSKCIGYFKYLVSKYFLLIPDSFYSLLNSLCTCTKLLMNTKNDFFLKVTAQLKHKMMIAGTLMVSYQPLGDKPNFFRSIISNSATREEDIDFMLEEMDRLGQDL